MNVNPDNYCCIRGKIADEPYFFCTKNGIEFKCSFSLIVKKNSKGQYNRIPVQIYGSEKMLFCHNNLRKGCVVAISGEFTSFSYEKNNIPVYSYALTANGIKLE